MRTTNYLFLILILIFVSCAGTKRMASENTLSVTEEELPELLKGALKQPEYLSPKEREMRQKLNEIYVYHVLVDTIKNEMRLDLSSKECAKLGLPTSVKKILGDALKKEVENSKKRGEQYYKWYLRGAAKSIAAERLKKGERGIFLTPIGGVAPE